jgi:hypothetical protein
MLYQQKLQKEYMLYHGKNYREKTCYIVAKITKREHVIYHNKYYREKTCYIIAKITERIHVLSTIVAKITTVFNKKGRRFQRGNQKL